MEKIIHGRPYKNTAKGPILVPCAPHGVLARLGDKWTILIMSILAMTPTTPLRFSEIKNGIPEISQRMLTVTLRNLQRDGLVLRHYFCEVPPRVEYELTLMGKTMLPALEGFTGWIRENWQAIERSRQAFDDSNGDL
ncbi:DNA-binding HxlR family transcriptional regulator [Phyllobacterium ifriqiyense]|uniref:DNA-binding HxlR family transcriptional regulator n=1 Tax=Phyllobacterium ifriqiyense TaxID=314238 RepID=A0ABU0S6V0_9HYPH|nr:helix-turn-helix domain-containing protein [Phyllobacterium ifriqiyense]MDQ0996371.1 DNA-binding HxlR family transcriptional regulator [Phyllobacterium ifriqiyense]